MRKKTQTNDLTPPAETVNPKTKPARGKDDKGAPPPKASRAASDVAEAKSGPIRKPKADNVASPSGQAPETKPRVKKTEPESKAAQEPAPKTAKSASRAKTDTSPSEPAKKALARPATKTKPITKFKPQSVTPTPEPAKSQKPAALKSLAELVEEEKANPKPKAPRQRKPSPTLATPPEPPAKSVAGDLAVTFRKSARTPSKKSKVDQPAEGRQRAKRQGKQVPAAKPKSDAPPEVRLEDLEQQVFGDDILVFWRSSRPGQGDAAVAQRKSRGRRRQDRTDQEITAAAALEPVAKDSSRRSRRGRGSRDETQDAAEPQQIAVNFRAPEPPKPPAKPVIPIPANAPRVILRNGIPTLVRDGKVFPPFAFFGSASDERRAQTVLAEVRRAAEADVHIHSVLVEMEVDRSAVDQAVAVAAYMLSKIVETDPETQLILRVVFVAPKGWESAYPDAAYLSNQGRIADPSVCDEKYWGVAQECLGEFIKQLYLLPSARSILGVHLDRGEWFYPEDQGYDNSKAATEAFQNWLRMRFVNDLVALRSAWFDGAAQFNTVQIPEYRKPAEEGEMFMRTNRKDRRWVDYHLFLSDATMHRIAELAYVAKEASGGMLLVGTNYGYTFEWSHPASGHLGLGKLLRTKEVDYISGPPSYRSREPGEDAPFPIPIDSLYLNGKLYFSEEDYKTAIGSFAEPDDYNPVIRTPQALEAVQLRGVGAALAHRSGLIWMDLWGNGWLNTSAIWDRGALARKALITRMAAPAGDPDVAVFIDERALAYLVDQRSFALLVQDVRESILRSGLSAGFYLMSDLAHRENFPDCKLSIFLNAWDIRPEHRLAIKNRLQGKGKVLFWLYGAGMFDSGREALERAREITGIAIKPQPFHSRTGTTILNRRHPLCEAFAEKGLIGGGRVDPSYFAIPEGATVLGEYSSSGLPSFVVREFNDDSDADQHWTSVFLGEPYVTPGLLRALAQMAGAHIWNYHSDVVHVQPPFLTVHCTGAGSRAIALPRNWSAYNLASGQWESEDGSTIKFQGFDGSTHLFLVGDRVELEHLLSLDPQDMLHIADLPDPSEDSVRFDSMQFDVPIMRLDEFMEGVPDEVADEWLLKPAMFETDIIDRENEAQGRSSEKVGSRRRNRNRSRDRRDSAPIVGEVSADNDLGMNVVFRKRD